MEITLEAIISLVGLFLGGTGICGFFFWKQKKRKEEAEARLAEAEAKLKEAEAKQAEVSVLNNMQEAYEKMYANVNTYLEDTKSKVDGMRQERDHYKQERDELFGKVEKLTKMFYELKTEGEKERSMLRVDIQQLRSQMKTVAPLTCGVLQCKLRQLVIISDDGEVKVKKPKKQQTTDVEPIEQEAL